jgi:1-acyl-sn-glycerol-3-phosphate acyltransferase
VSLLGRIVRTILGAPFLFLYMCVMASGIILGGESNFSEICLTHWCRVVLFVAGAKVTVRRNSTLDPKKSYVFICNHTSHMDAPAIIANIGRPLRLIAKRSLSYIPFFGTAAKRMGHVFIDRKDRRAATMAIQRRLEHGLTDGVGLFFFAEGTRNGEDALLPFKKGASIAAIETGLDVVPIAIAGAREVLPPNQFSLFTPGPITLVVGEPIPVASYTLDTRDELTALQQAAVQKLVDEARSMLGKN